jgi:2,4-dienoyl-CoA reductase (NADPH2)
MNLTTKGVERVRDFEVKQAVPGRMTMRNVLTDQEEELEADTLVTSYWRSADTRLSDELKGKVKEILKVGDCLAPRRVINAIYEEYKVAMGI